MLITEKYVFFWGGIYSQWYPANMLIDEIEYNTCEQYMMHQKALLFNDLDVADEVLRTSHPMDQKALGRKIRNFDRTVWDKNCLRIVYKGNLAKFTQHKDLNDDLLATGDRIFVEASPKDFIWGVGLSETDIKIQNPINWVGTNLLGQAITLVKQELIYGK